MSGCPSVLTVLGQQSRFGDKNHSNVSSTLPPKRNCSLNSPEIVEGAEERYERPVPLRHHYSGKV